jgi:hypothetical protein
MKELFKLAAAAALGALASGGIVYAQAGSSAPPKARIAIYRAAPGQQVALLKWFDAQNRAAAAAGVPTGVIYAHTDGDSWDYLAIDPARRRRWGWPLAPPPRSNSANISPRTPIRSRSGRSLRRNIWRWSGNDLNAWRPVDSCRAPLTRKHEKELPPLFIYR